LSGFAPGLIGDSITFAGNTALTPNVDQNFSATGLIFSNNASSFTVGTANSSTLTLTANGIVNNSANAQTITAPLNISSTEPVNATAGNIAISSTISGTGGIAKTGNSQLTLTGSGSSLGGSLSVNAGILSVPGGSSAFGGQPSRVGYLTGSGTLNMTGGSLSNSGELQVGGSDQSGTGINAAGAINLTSATLSVGALTVARGNNPQNTVSGLVTLNSGSTLNCEGDCLVDFAGAVSGKIVVNGGTLNHATTTKRWFIMSEWDFGSSEVDVNSGQVNINANTDIRFATQGNTGTNVFNLNGGAVTFFSDNGTTVGGSGVLDLHQGNGSTVNNSFNLNGGTLTVSAITSANASGTRAFNFNGGTLKAPAANATFMALGTGSAAAAARLSTTVGLP
jgi:autotransporter-associated beta strand protein